MGVIAVGLSCPLGVLVGLIAGYAGRRADDVLMRITDVQLAIPTILLAIAVVAVLGPGLGNVILTLSCAYGSSVRVWGGGMLRGRDARKGRPPPEGVHVDYPLVTALY